jgi:hypothetical protein
MILKIEKKNELKNYFVNFGLTPLKSQRLSAAKQA